jgi:hypothetical protein
MRALKRDNARRVVFVCRELTGESLRSAQALTRLDGVEVLAICETAPNSHSEEIDVRTHQVGNVHDPAQLVGAMRELIRKYGPVDHIVTTRETLLEPVAQVAEMTGVKGMTVSTVRRVLDKSSLKAVLKCAGIQTARDRLVTTADKARLFADEVGFPIVLKPMHGSGGLATWRIANAQQLEDALALTQPSLDNVYLAEEYIVGDELCLDTITLANEPRFYSVCCYRPSILEALENPQVQWKCIMPRDITGPQYRDFIEQGLAAVRALSVGNAITHMEGFRLDDGSVRFIDATIRPAGARIAPMLAFAYDIDPYLAWASVAVNGCFDGPWERKYAVGTIFLRAPGSGVIEEVQGIESLNKNLGHLIVDYHLPVVGFRKSSTYTGDGYVTVRNEDTSVVEDVLDLIGRTVSIRYSEPQSIQPADSKESWADRLQYFERQINKPAWDECVQPPA